MLCVRPDGDGGQTNLTCGAGTHMASGQCVADGDAGGSVIDAGTPLTCGAGTHAMGGQCIADGPAAYEIRIATTTLSADGFSKVPLLAIGHMPDGTPATDQVVFSMDRVGAGAFDSPQVMLRPLGTMAYFTPCSSAVAGCVGPLHITLALASAPNLVVARTPELTLNAPAGIGSAVTCLGGGNTIFYDGNDYIFNGTETIKLGAWSASGSTTDVTIHVDPSDRAQGLWWDLDFSSRQLNQPLRAQVYLDAERAPFASPGHPGIDIGGDGRGCNTISGKFQIEDIQWNGTKLQTFTATFEQHCEGGSNSLRGCVHFEQ